jgi:putative transposase
MSSDIYRIRLRSRFNELFSQSRSVADSRSIVSAMQEDDEQIGWFKVRDLIRERELISKQPGSHAYKKRWWSDRIFRIFSNREFNSLAPNQGWCGNITTSAGRKENGNAWQ